jgi:hypothetical protein
MEIYTIEKLITIIRVHGFKNIIKQESDYIRNNNYFLKIIIIIIIITKLLKGLIHT